MSRMRLALPFAPILMGSTALAEVPHVAVDIAPLHSLVAQVMDGVGTPDLIVAPGASPHGYSLRPSEAAALDRADLVFWIGEDLAPWLAGPIETLADGADVTALLEAEGTVLLDFREGALFEAHDHGDHGHGDHGHEDHSHHDHEHDDHAHKAHDHKAHDHKDHDHAHDDHAHHDHSHGEKEHNHHDHDHAHDDHAHDHGHDHTHADDHGHGHDHGHDHGHHHGHAHGAHDPHAWLSPANAATWLNVIAAKLSAQDPGNAGTYFANAEKARADLDSLTAEITATLDPVRGGRFIVFHDAYQYFETHFDFPASGAISIGDASQPSPARIAEIQGRLQSEGIECVLSEPQFNPGILETVLAGVEAKTEVIDPLGAELELGPALYPQLLRNMATSLANCL